MKVVGGGRNHWWGGGKTFERNDEERDSAELGDPGEKGFRGAKHFMEIPQYKTTTDPT